MGITHIRQILDEATRMEASDIHLFADKRPVFRINGQLMPSNLPILIESEIEGLLNDILTANQKKVFETHSDLDFSYSYNAQYHFRFNTHYGDRKIAATIRILSQTIPSREELNLPEIVETLSRKRQGLIVVSGTAGCGKSTTLNYILDLINTERKAKIITIEDPIEYRHKSKQSYFLQREVGVDTQSFASALKYALRQDPDVVSIGEIRDLESISMALTTAETGHLVITTVHAPDAIETINRIVDVHPMGSRDQVFIQLARNLIGVISQTLIPRSDQESRILATEILKADISVSNLIRRGALVELRGQLDSMSDINSHSLEWYLSQLYHRGIISEKTAHEYANYEHSLKHFINIVSKRAQLRNATEQIGGREIQKDLDKKIYVLDSVDYMRVEMVLKLREMGFENIIFGASGLDAVTTIETESPDIVLMSIYLSDMNSFKLCTEIKNINGTPPMVILFSDEIKPNDLVKANKAGADDLVSNVFNHPLFTPIAV